MVKVIKVLSMGGHAEYFFRLKICGGSKKNLWDVGRFDGYKG